jgi:RNA polymerase primary sigma factor
MVREDGIEEYFKEINRFKLLSREEEFKVIFQMKQGCEDSREYLIGCNLRLVVSIAKHYVGRGLTLLDLIEEGNVGLIKAASHFRQEEGCRFSTYATWWIHQAIKRALVDTAKTVRIPSYLAPKIAHWKRVAARMTETLQRAPSLRELAHECQIDEQRFEIFQSALATSNSISQAVSLDVSKGEEDSLMDSLACRNTPRPEDQYFDSWERSHVSNLLETIAPRDAEVLRMRYGLGGYEPMTLQEIGERIHLSRERVRQIEGEALSKLHGFLVRDGAGV